MHNKRFCTFAIAALALFCVQGFAFAVNNPPALGTVSPSSGAVQPGVWTTFTCTYSDPDGASNLGLCYLLVNNRLSSSGGAYFYYNRLSNKLYMKTNAGAQIGGTLRGTVGAVESENAKIDCAATTVATSGNTLTVAWRVWFKPGVSGKNCNLYMQAADLSGSTTGWVDKGDSRVNAPPTVGTVSPASEVVQPGQWKTFSCTYSDPDGAPNLGLCYLLVNNAVACSGGAYFIYNRVSNKLYMKTNGGTQIGGTLRGTAGVIESENAKIDCAATTVTTSGNTVTIAWRVWFKPAMSGKNCNLYLQAADCLAYATGWLDKGDVSLTNPPTVGTASPASGTVPVDSWTTVTCTYSDLDGVSNLAMCYLLINNAVASSGGAYFFYSKAANKLYMKNNAGTQIGGTVRGVAGTIESENARIDCAATTATATGNTLTVAWRVQFRSPMQGKNCNLYMQASDLSGSMTGWVDKGDLSVNNPSPPVSSVYGEPTQLTLLAGTTYDFARAHALDADGQVISSTTSFTWSSQNASTASVTKTGLTPDGRYCGATISALSVGQTTVTVEAGGQTKQIAVKVVANPSATADRFLAIPVDQAPGLDSVPITQNGYRYAYFYGEPGKEYRFRFEKVEGYQSIWISSDPSFADSDKSIDAGNNYGSEFASDIVTPNGYGAYYVKMKGNSSVNFVDVTVSNGSSPCAYSVSGGWSRVEPNGQTVYDSVGRKDIQYYYFPVNANAKYYVEVAKLKGYNAVWVDDATDWVTPIVASNNYGATLKQSLVAGQNGFDYIAVRGEELSNFYRLRVCAEDPTIAGYQVHVTPGNISLPAGTSRTIFADCIAPSGSIATASTSFEWVSDNPAVISVTPGSLDASGFFRQATITAPADLSGPTDTVVRVTANGITDRITVRAIDMSQLYAGSAEQIQLNAAFPAQVSLGNLDSKVYWYQTQPGVEYRLTVSDSAGSVNVWVCADPLLFDVIENGNTYGGPHTYDFVAPVYGGTQFVLIKGRESSNTASIQLNTVAPPSSAEVYYPRGTAKALAPNAGAYYSRATNSGGPDTYTFVTDTEFARYTVSVSDSAGYVVVYVADNILGSGSLSSGNTYGAPYSYAFLADTPGKRYYVLVYGKESANHYSITLTKQ